MKFPGPYRLKWLCNFSITLSFTSIKDELYRPHKVYRGDVSDCRRIIHVYNERPIEIFPLDGHSVYQIER